MSKLMTSAHPCWWMLTTASPVNGTTMSPRKVPGGSCVRAPVTTSPVLDVIVYVTLPL